MFNFLRKLFGLDASKSQVKACCVEKAAKLEENTTAVDAKANKGSKAKKKTTKSKAKPKTKKSKEMKTIYYTIDDETILKVQGIDVEKEMIDGIEKSLTNEEKSKNYQIVKKISKRQK